MRYNIIRIGILLFFCQNILWSQTPSSDVTRKGINNHITYINNCIDYLGAVKLTLEEFNTDVNQHYSRKNFSSAKKKHNPLEINYDLIPETNRFKINELDKQYALLRNDRALMDLSTEKSLNKALEEFQIKFDHLASILSKLIRHTRDTESFFKDPSFKKTYDYILSIENDIKKVTTESDRFYATTIRLFGKENLPNALQYTKKIAFSYKEMAQHLRAEDKTGLQKTIIEFEVLDAVRLTEKQSLGIEKWGDFDSKDNSQLQERADIERGTKDPIRIINGYLNYDVSPCSNAFLKKYSNNDYYCWLTTFNNYKDSRNTVIGKYNSYVKRAKEPVLNIVQEIRPFKMILPDDWAPAIIEEIQEEVIAAAPEKVEEPKIDTINIAAEKAIFKAEDVTSLDGAKVNNLVLLLDVSGSMKYNNNEAKLKNSIKHLIDILRPQDKLTVISYAGTPEKVLETGPNQNKEALKEIIQELRTGGETNAQAALEMAYSTLQSKLLSNGNNRIIVASDGDFIINDEVKTLINTNLPKGITLSTFHYIYYQTKGREVLEDLAKHGKGNYSMIRKETDAISALISESKQGY